MLFISQIILNYSLFDNIRDIFAHCSNTIITNAVCASFQVLFYGFDFLIAVIPYMVLMFNIKIYYPRNIYVCIMYVCMMLFLHI